MSINYRIEGKSPLGTKQVQAISDAIGKALNIQHQYNIGLSFISSDSIRSLNAKYAKNDYPTDVLSFEYGDEGADGNYGDIAICTEIAQLQAKDNGISEVEELSLLLIHGTLHILGYDHQTKEQTASLDALQGDIMNLLNYKYRDFKWAH